MYSYIKTLKLKIMKKIIYLFLIGCVLSISSCTDDFVNVDPTTTVTDEQVWQDENLVNAFLNNVYNTVEFVDLAGGGNFHMGLIGGMGAEFRVFGPWQEPYIASTTIIEPEGARGSLNYFKWFQLRDINLTIEKLSTESNLSQGFIEQKIAEARFLRAFIYFEMVKRYGGMPIITEAQGLETPIEELFVSRNSSQEVYDFIISDLEFAAQYLSEVASAASGRPSKWAALGLLSRAAMYAGSIGEFGVMQLDGLLGIPNPQTYWQKAYDTAKIIINESGHALYNGNSDKAINFQNLFVDENNSEVIFSQRFDPELKPHSFSNLAQPDGFNAGWGSNYNVFYDTVKLFDFEDGTTGNIPDSQLTGQRWTSEELFGKRDPRFRASVFYPEAPWQGSMFTSHWTTTNYDSAPEGWQLRANTRNRVRTGFHLRKRIDESLILPPGNTDGTDYIVLRLGEIYLNLAEAAFQLGKIGEATDAVNMVRDRAGMPARGTVTWDNIIQERRVELFAEDHSYWDLRRWRIAAQEINGKSLKGLRFTYDGITRDYSIQIRNAEGNIIRPFQERNYYLPIGLARISDNPNLVENPGYEN